MGMGKWGRGEMGKWGNGEMDYWVIGVIRMQIHSGGDFGVSAHLNACRFAVAEPVEATADFLH